MYDEFIPMLIYMCPAVSLVNDPLKRNGYSLIIPIKTNKQIK
jgi:hypothetical protein